jgi:adenylate cyclase
MTLNPNDDLVPVEHARLLMNIDRPEDGLMRVREAMRLNPYHPNWYWNAEGTCLHIAGRYEEAIDAFDRVDSPQFWVEAYLRRVSRHVRQVRTRCAPPRADPDHAS